MKLFVWENVLVDWMPGIMFALAHSEDEARELVVAIRHDVERYHAWRRGELKTSCPPMMWRDLESKPTCVIAPRGFAVWGSS